MDAVALQTAVEGDACHTRISPELPVYSRAGEHLIDRMSRAGQLTDRLYVMAQIVLAVFARNPVEFEQQLPTTPAAHGEVLLGMCLGRHPGVKDLSILQATLSRLSERWGVLDARTPEVSAYRVLEGTVRT